MLTSSQRGEDVLRSYSQGANCHVTKLSGLVQFVKISRNTLGILVAIVKPSPKKRWRVIITQGWSIQ